MMNHLHVTRHPWILALFVALGMLAIAGVALRADTSDRTGETFTWSAELVEFDDATTTMTVKSRIVGDEMTDWPDFERGDRVVLTWSGLTLASGVRHIAFEGAEIDDARMRMPVEFVSVDDRSHLSPYLTFRVPIPADDTDRIAMLTPGAWITAQSPYDVPEGGQVVETVRPYAAAGWTEPGSGGITT